jgi:hypothetical protein
LDLFISLLRTGYLANCYTIDYLINLANSHYFSLQADDPELEAIRQRRMAEMMAQQGGGKVRRTSISSLLYNISVSSMEMRSI